MKMAALPSPTQVAGSQFALYEAYFNQLEKHGTVPAIDAAKFLKQSGLPDVILSKIWDLSDPSAKGYLNKAGFFVSLKLISLAQLGHDINTANLSIDIPAPKMGATAHPVIPGGGGSLPTINSVPATISDWAMKPPERAKYEQLFDSLQPLNGVIPGNKVKGLLIDSKLPVHTLGKIWDLADMDKDGSLDRHEFIVAMHLVYKALEKYAIPSSLPPELLPPGKRKESIPPITNHQSFNGGTISWVVTPEEKAQYDNLFQLTDIDKDGFVSGPEIKDVFLQSGVPQPVLANIWGLCDIKQSGKLNAEQFALAMWLIQQKLKGIDPPQSLTQEMIPPSLRTKGYTNENNNAPYTTNPEIEMITKDIEELMREKQNLESEIIQKEADIKIKSGEAKSLQGELDTLAATLKQLENQKGEAQKRLNDLKNQSVHVEVKMVLDLEQKQVDKLLKQAEEQKAIVKAQEEELSSKKQELEELKGEETKLEALQNQLMEKLGQINDSLQDSQLNISQIKTKISQVQDNQRQLNDAIAIIDIALTGGDISTVTQRHLDLEPDFRDPSYTRLLNSQQVEQAETNGNIFKPKTDVTTDSFSHSTFNNDPFTATDHFSSPFQPSPNSGFGNDPFSSFGGSSTVKSDPFDPFGSSSSSATAQKVPDDAGQDPFGCEPFGNAAPALPPKNKQPPPRPAPPRPAAPPATVSHSSPASADAFADFSNFNAKFDSQSAKLDFTEDPFRDYRYEDPFNIADPFEEPSNLTGASEGMETKSDPFTPSKSEPTQMNKFKSDEQLIDWSKKNSVKGDSNKANTKDGQFTKCDSLPSLLS